MKYLFLKPLCFGLLLIIVLVAHAQKLPNVQQASLRAPLDVKIDGQATEWGGQYQAYNKNVEFFYSVANDDDNLYVIIHAAKSRIIEKIIEGGVTFTVNSTGKKDDNGSSRVLFPLMPLPICKGTLVAAGKSLTGITSTDGREDITAQLNADARDKKLISIAKANIELTDNLKNIKIAGIDAIKDTVPGVKDTTKYYRTLPLRAHYLKIIALHNQDGINAMVQFDPNGELNYELAIPIKYLAQVQKDRKFFYSITVNGRGEDGRPGNTWRYSPPPNQGIIDQDMEEPTYFWGEYTLAKKQ